MNETKKTIAKKGTIPVLFVKRDVVAAIFLVSIFVLLTTVVSADTYYVNPGESIATAVLLAGEDDTIIVRDGTYTENIDVTINNLTIQSENGSANCIVNALSSGDSVFGVTADYVTISGFTVKNTMGEHTVGIFLYNGSKHCTISDNIVTANDYDGILLYSSCNNTLSGNIVTANNHDGIYVSSFSDNNTLTGNIVTSNNNDGITLQASSNNNLTNNTMSGNYHNFVIWGSPSNSIHTIDTSNEVEGKPIYYWLDQHDKVIPSDAGFVGIVNSTNITVRNLVLTNNGMGVLLVSSTNSRIEKITASNTEYGIYLLDSSNNTLTNNTANENHYGIFVRSSSNNNTLTDNTVRNNGANGIRLSGSNDNLIYNNSFDNAINAYDDGNNIWNTTLRAGTNIIGGPNIGGNYWSDYAGIDTSGDKIGDTLLPYDSSGNIQHGGDWLPLANLPVHNSDTGESFATIQQAIDAGNTTTGHHIEVDPGTYKENVKVTKRLTIQSSSGKRTDAIVTALDANDHIFDVTADHVHLQGLTITNATGPNSAGIYLAEGTSQATVNFAVFTNNNYGIQVYKSNNNKITYIDSRNNNYSIYMFDSDDNVISSNAALSNHKVGIFISSSDGTTLTYNTAVTNSHSGIVLSYVNDSYIFYNVVDGNTYDGITLFNAYNNLISTNSVMMNQENGMKLGSSSENTITGNTFYANTYNGIYLDENSEDTIIHFNNFNNIVVYGDYGVYNNNTNETVNAESNWWDSASGPGGAGNGTGKKVSSCVDFEPWLGGESYTEEVIDDTVDARTEADTEVEVDGTATVTVAKYAGNPAGNPPAGFSAAGDYIDVYVGDTSGVTEIEIRNYYTDAEIAGLDESSLRLRYWNGAAWVACSNSGVSTAATGGYSGYVWAKINDSTTPDLTYLQGGVFGAIGAKAPNTQITDGPTGEINTRDVTFNWTGSDDSTPTNQLMYSYKLEGYDGSWSAGTPDTSRSYSGLSNGDYTFKVKAKDQDDAVDQTPDERSFTVYVVSRGGGGGAPRDSDGDGYSDIEEMLAETNPNDPCDPNSECAACLAIRPPMPTPTPISTATPTSETTGTPLVPPAATPTPANEEEEMNTPVPGFGAVFAIAGLFVVAYLVRKRRKGE